MKKKEEVNKKKCRGSPELKGGRAMTTADKLRDLTAHLYNLTAGVDPEKMNASKKAALRQARDNCEQSLKALNTLIDKK